MNEHALKTYRPPRHFVFVTLASHPGLCSNDEETKYSASMPWQLKLGGERTE